MLGRNLSAREVIENGSKYCSVADFLCAVLKFDFFTKDLTRQSASRIRT
jgi:hypothetical protein